MAETGWDRVTFAGAAAAKAREIAALSPAERVQLLEELLEMAEMSGALGRAREAKQREIDALFAP